MDMTDEQYVRKFAETFPTPNVLMALTLCETGVLSWDVVADLLKESLTDSLKTMVARLN
jgi:hypothetical protein